MRFVLHKQIYHFCDFTIHLKINACTVCGLHYFLPFLHPQYWKTIFDLNPTSDTMLRDDLCYILCKGWHLEAVGLECNSSMLILIYSRDEQIIVWLRPVGPIASSDERYIYHNSDKLKFSLFIFFWILKYGEGPNHVREDEKKNRNWSMVTPLYMGSEGLQILL